MENNQIKYTSSKKLHISEDKFNNVITEHTFVNKTGTITFKKDLSFLPLAAFAFSNTLEEVYLPDSIETIDIEAFCATRKLKKIILGKNVKSIFYRGFHDAHLIEEITLPETVMLIAEDAFDSCVSLKKINIPGNVGSGLGPSVFSSCFKLEDVTLGEGLKKIPDYTFRKCKSLKEITLPTTIEKIGMKVFSGCVNLQKVYCKPLTPPKAPTEYIISGGINKNVVDSWLAFKNVKNVTIYVPIQSLDLYKTTTGWSEYADYIQPYEYDEYKEPEINEQPTE